MFTVIVMVRSPRPRPPPETRPGNLYEENYLRGKLRRLKTPTQLNDGRLNPLGLKENVLGDI